MSLSRAEIERIERLSKRYVRNFDKRKLAGLSKEVLLAIGFEAGLKSRARIEWKPLTTTKVFVKPKSNEHTA